MSDALALAPPKAAAPPVTAETALILPYPAAFALAPASSEPVPIGNPLPQRQSIAGVAEVAMALDGLLAMVGLPVAPDIIAAVAPSSAVPPATTVILPGSIPTTAWASDIALDNAAANLPVRVEVALAGRAADISLSSPAPALRAAWAGAMPQLVAAAHEAGVTIAQIAVAASVAARRPAGRRSPSPANRSSE